MILLVHAKEVNIIYFSSLNKYILLFILKFSNYSLIFSRSEPRPGEIIRGRTTDVTWWGRASKWGGCSEERTNGAVVWNFQQREEWTEEKSRKCKCLETVLLLVEFLKILIVTDIWELLKYVTMSLSSNFDYL